MPTALSRSARCLALALARRIAAARPSAKLLWRVDCDKRPASLNTRRPWSTRTRTHVRHKTQGARESHATHAHIHACTRVSGRA